MVQYILKKPLPDSQPGDIYIWNDSMKAYYKHGNVQGSYWTAEHVEGNDEWFERFETVPKPPIGLMPLWLHREQRLSEIRMAMHRYIEAGLVVPKEWLAEMQTLESWLQPTK